jgi:hypothetical protein
LLIYSLGVGINKVQFKKKKLKKKIKKNLSTKHNHRMVPPYYSFYQLPMIIRPNDNGLLFSSGMVAQLVGGPSSPGKAKPTHG